MSTGCYVMHVIKCCIEYLINEIFNKCLKLLSPDQMSVYCSWYFPKIIDKFCFNLTKMTSYIEYLVHKIVSNNKLKVGMD